MSTIFRFVLVGAFVCSGCVQSSSPDKLSGDDQNPGVGAQQPKKHFSLVRNSNDGGYQVDVRCKQEAIPLNEPFDMVVAVQRTDDRSISDQVRVAVDARMPTHYHGMNRTPVVKHLKDGTFEAKGMLLHMPGAWELYVDITDGYITERTQFNLNLD